MTYRASASLATVGSGLFLLNLVIYTINTLGLYLFFIPIATHRIIVNISGIILFFAWGLIGTYFYKQLSERKVIFTKSGYQSISILPLLGFLFFIIDEIIRFIVHCISNSSYFKGMSYSENPILPLLLSWDFISLIFSLIAWIFIGQFFIGQCSNKEIDHCITIEKRTSQFAFIAVIILCFTKIITSILGTMYNGYFNNEAFNTWIYIFRILVIISMVLLSLFFAQILSKKSNHK